MQLAPQRYAAAAVLLTCLAVFLLCYAVYREIQTPSFTQAQLISIPSLLSNASVCKQERTDTEVIYVNCGGFF